MNESDKGAVIVISSHVVRGTVGNRAAQPGQLVQSGTRLMALVPLETAYVEANFKETQIAGLYPGQSVDIEVDAFSHRHIEGKVVSIAPASGSQFSLLPPENATGNFTKIVQRVPVRIAVPAELAREGLLRPGLSVVVGVHLREAPAQFRHVGHSRGRVRVETVAFNDAVEFGGGQEGEDGSACSGRGRGHALPQLLHDGDGARTFDAAHVDDLAVFELAQKHRLARLLREALHHRRGFFVEVGALYIAMPQRPEQVAKVVTTGMQVEHHHLARLQRGKDAEDRALGETRTAGQLGEAKAVRLLGQQFEQVEGAVYRGDDVRISRLHRFQI